MSQFSPRSAARVGLAHRERCSVVQLVGSDPIPVDECDRRSVSVNRVVRPDIAVTDDLAQAQAWAAVLPPDGIRRGGERRGCVVQTPEEAGRLHEAVLGPCPIRPGCRSAGLPVGVGQHFALQNVRTSRPASSIPMTRGAPRVPDTLQVSEKGVDGRCPRSRRAMKPRGSTARLLCHCVLPAAAPRRSRVRSCQPTTDERRNEVRQRLRTRAPRAATAARGCQRRR